MDKDEQNTFQVGSQSLFGEEPEPLHLKDEKKRKATYKDIRIALALSLISDSPCRQFTPRIQSTYFAGFPFPISPCSYFDLDSVTCITYLNVPAPPSFIANFQIDAPESNERALRQT